jgi:hypothetical protein
MAARKVVNWAAQWEQNLAGKMAAYLAVHLVEQRARYWVVK